MSSVFEASLSFDRLEEDGMERNGESGLFHIPKDEEEQDADGVAETEKMQNPDGGNYDSWLLQRRVKIKRPHHDDVDWMSLLGDGDGDELGDSCCFGTRTVQFGTDDDCIWKMHGARNLT